MVTQSNMVVRDGLGEVVTRRAYDIDGARADGPFVPEIGEKSDGAWGGAGSGSMIAVLKAIWGKLAGTLSIRSGVQDSTGAWIYPDSLRTSAVTRDANRNLLTETKTDGTNTWVYTITRDANGDFASDTLWVRQ